MKILDTSPITSAVGFPPKSGTWNFLQLAYQECVESIIRNLIGSAYSTSNAYVLWGILPSGPFSLSAGAIFYNGKIYLYSGGLAPVSYLPNVALVNISQTQYTTNADPVLFTDSNTYNVHNIFSISLSSGTSGTGGICDFSALIRLDSYATLRGAITTLQSDVDTLQSEIDVLNADIYAINTIHAWTNYAGAYGTNWSSGLSTIRYTKDSAGRVYLQGYAHSAGGPAGVVLTMPSGYRPSRNLNFIVAGVNSLAPTPCFVSIAASTGVVTVFNPSGFVAGDDLYFDNVMFPTI